MTKPTWCWWSESAALKTELDMAQAENARLRRELARAEAQMRALECARDVAVRLAVSGAPGPRATGSGPVRTRGAP